MTVTIILVLELIICSGWISPSNAQLQASIFPQGHQSVCRGESISYNCFGNGTDMSLYSPPIVNRSEPFDLPSSAPVQTCPAVQDSAAACVVVDSSASSSFVATLTLFISDEQSEGQRTVYCRVVGGGRGITASSDFSVLDTPSISDIQRPDIVPLSYSEDGAHVTVNISWNSPVNAQEFTLTISDATGFMSKIRSFDNRVTVLLPYGTYSAYLCVINRCGKVCRDFPSSLPVESQQAASVDVHMDSALLASAVIAGLVGVFFIISVVYGVVITIIWFKMK